MENFKILKERIKTCITCDEGQCPSIKERFHNHIRSHHTPRPSTVNQGKPASISIENQTSNSHISLPSYSRETSTTNLDIEKVSSNRKINIENINNQILEWSRELPIYFNPNFENLKQNTVNELIANLAKFAVNTNQAHNRLEHEIDKCINFLPLTTDEHNQLKNSLINRIHILLNKVSNDYTVLNFDESENLKDKTLKDESTNVPKFFYDSTGRYNNDFEDMIGGQNSYIDVLSDMNASRVLIKPILIDSKINNVNIFDSNFTQTYKSWSSIESQETPGLKFTNYVQYIIRYQLKISGVYSDDLCKNISDIFNIELVPGKLEEQKIKVIKLLKNSTTLSVDHIYRIADYISDKLKMFIKENIRMSKSALCGVSVYRSQHDCHKYNILSLNSMEKSNESSEEVQNIKLNENMLRKNIAAEIKSWINTLPMVTENKHWKEIPTKSLINDLVEHLKIDQLMLETKTNKENCMFFFITRWLNKIELFKDLNDAKPYVYDLIERLNKIPIPTLAKKQGVDMNKSEKKIKNESYTSTLEVDILGNEIRLWLNENSSYMQHKVKKNKLNQMINKLSKSVCDHINKKSSLNASSKEISQWISKIIKPEMKGDTQKLSDDLKYRLYTLFDSINNTSNKKPMFVNDRKQTLMLTPINEIFKSMFKDLVQKYIDVLSEEENVLAKDVYKNIFINKINNMFGTNNLLTQDTEKLLAKKLNNELHNIEIVLDWLQINPIKDLSKKLSSAIRRKIAMDIFDILNKISDNSTKIKSNSNLHEILILDDLPFTIEDKDFFYKCAKDLISEVTSTNQNAFKSNQDQFHKQNRNEVIAEYIYLQCEHIIEDELKFDCIIDHMLKGMNARNDNIQQVDIKLFSNELDFAKEICHWLNNLPLLSVSDVDAYIETLKVVTDFNYKIIELFYPAQSTSICTDKDVNECSVDFILKLPLNPKKEIDVQSAAQQLKKRFERIYKRNQEPNEQSKSCSKGTCKNVNKSYGKGNFKNIEKYNASMGISQAIEEWWHNLPIKESNESSNRHLKQRVIQNLHQKFDELIMNPECFNDSFLCRNELSQEIDTQLQHLVLQDDTQNSKEALKQHLLDIIMEHINFIKEKYNRMHLEKDRNGKTHIPEGATIQIDKPTTTPLNNTTTELHLENKTLLNDHAFSMPTCCKRQSVPKNPADLIIKIVKLWCQELPLPENTQHEKENAKIIRDDVFIKIIMKISELNINPETFNESDLYDTLLEDELNSILSTLPACFELIHSKTIRINQLKDAIKNVNTLLIKEKERYEYKQKLKNAVEEVLKSTDAEPANTSFTNLCDEIVDAFIIYSYDEVFKDKTSLENTIHNNTSKYYGDIKEKEKYFLFQHNKDEILDKLSKIPSPSKSLLKEEVKEIRLKSELKRFLDDLLPPEYKISLKNQIIPVLAKRLNELKKHEPSFENQLIMRDEIIKCLKKFDEKIDKNKVNAFVERLKNQESIQKKSTLAYKKYNRNNEIPVSETYQEPLPHISTSQINQSNNLTGNDVSDENDCNSQWFSLPPASSVEESITKNSNKTQKTSESTSESLRNQLNYNDFEKGINLRSSLTENVPYNKKQKEFSQTFNGYNGYEKAENETYDSTDQESQYLKFEKGLNLISPSIENITVNKQTLHPISESTENKLNNLEFEEGINADNNKQQTELSQTSDSCENQIYKGKSTKKKSTTHRKLSDRSEIPDVSYHRPYKYEQYKNNDQSFSDENNKWKLSQELNSHVRRTSSQTQTTSNNDSPLKRTYEYGKSYRKPSITLIAPKNKPLDPNNYYEKKQTSHQKNYKNEIAIYEDKEVDKCGCEEKIMQQLNKNSCLERKRKICICCKTCCDGVPPRYPGFHYY